MVCSLSRMIGFIFFVPPLSQFFIVRKHMSASCIDRFRFLHVKSNHRILAVKLSLLQGIGLLKKVALNFSTAISPGTDFFLNTVMIYKPTFAKESLGTECSKIICFSMSSSQRLQSCSRNSGSHRT